MRIRRLTPLALILSFPLAACSTGGHEDTQQLDPVAESLPGVFVGNSDALQMAEQISLEYLYDVEPALVEGIDGLWTKQVKVDHLGMAHTRLIQTVDNVLVFGGEAMVHLNADGSFNSITDGFVRNVQVDTRPVLADIQAIDLAVADSGGWSKVTGMPAAELNIVRQAGTDHLTYRVQVDQYEDGVEPAQWVVFVNAANGEIVNKYNNIQTAKNRRTYSANNGSSLPGTLIRSEGQGPVSDAIVNMAHDNAGLTYDYYSSAHARDSYNGSGATIHSTVHYGSNYVNAFWNGSQMVYGDGDGTTASALTVLDVVAHELTHAVTSSESNLTYQNESGALNESMSDIFAAAVEATRDGGVNSNTWKIGEECWTPGTAGDALRYMNNPTQDGSSKDYYPERYTGTQDNGGVHWNSGIPNLAFVLLTQGGTHPRGKTTVNVPGIGITKAAKIFYYANANCLVSSSNMEAARNCTAQGAANLYAQAEVDAVHLAWDAVGVPGGDGGGGGGDTCEGYCGGKSAGACYCDSACVNYGDCCPDYDSVCNGGGGYPGVELTQSNLSGSQGTWRHYTLSVPADANTLAFNISGGSGDADLYVKFGSQPTTSSYNCRPYKAGNTETCSFTNPSAGTWYVSIRAYSSYSGVTLTGDYDI